MNAIRPTVGSFHTVDSFKPRKVVTIVRTMPHDVTNIMPSDDKIFAISIAAIVLSWLALKRMIGREIIERL